MASLKDFVSIGMKVKCLNPNEVLVISDIVENQGLRYSFVDFSDGTTEIAENLLNDSLYELYDNKFFYGALKALIIKHVNNEK